VAQPTPRRVKSVPHAAPVEAHERPRDSLAEAECLRLLQGTRDSRYRWRNTAMLLRTFYHGLRVSELCDLKRQDVDTHHGRIWIARLTGSLSTAQPLRADELRALTRYRAERGDAQGPWGFLTARGAQFTRFAMHYLVRGTGERAGLPFHVHPHMLRHGCGYAVAHRGYDLRLMQDYLGHRDPKHTTR
jgi:type 1 fimbriae regulatory protein FimB